MIKEKVKDLEKRIKETNLYKLLRANDSIKRLENEKGDLETKNKQLIDKNRVLNLEVGKYKKHDEKIKDLKREIEDLNVLLEVEKQHREEARQENQELVSELFQTNLELGKYKVQCQEYESQIEDYRTEGRYLIKTLKPDRTKSKIKTKISKPMAGSVVRYMKNEYQ